MNKKLVSIIIVNWNGKKWLKKCFDSLYSQNYKNIEIILIDNASTDNSVEFVKNSYPKVKIIKNKTNLGFAEANNIGYQKSQGEYILLLNNDTITDKFFLIPLVKYLSSNPEVGAVQPKILIADQPHKIQIVGSFFTGKGILYHYGFYKDKNKFNKPEEIFSALGACMLIKKEVIEEVGLFDPDFFAYAEETDFCWRVWLAGKKIVFIPDSIIYHKGAATASKMPSTFFVYHSIKNTFCYLIKNLGSWQLSKILPIYFLLSIIGSFTYLLTLQSKNFFAIYRGMWWNVINIKNTLNKRLVIQGNIRKISDKNLLPQIKRKIKLIYYYYYILRRLKEYKD